MAFVTVAVALIIALSVGLVVTLSSGGSGRAAQPASYRMAQPASSRAGTSASEDVAAARACAAFTTYLDDASRGDVPQAAGQALAQSAGQLLVGAAADQKAGRPLPKWTALGEELVAVGDDVVNRDSSAFQQDGTAAAETCHTIPAEARQAGGYAPNGS